MCSVVKLEGASEPKSWNRVDFCRVSCIVFCISCKITKANLVRRGSTAMTEQAIPENVEVLSLSAKNLATRRKSAADLQENRSMYVEFVEYMHFSFPRQLILIICAGLWVRMC